MTRRKLLGTLAFVLAMFVLIWSVGQLWITRSVPYELGRAAVGSKVGIDPGRVELKRFAAFQFSDGAFAGKALFVLCAPSEKCFTVVAKKSDARWLVVDLVEQ
jgi:hypothetical protein